jgi:phosphate butyryltransferase
MNLTGLDQLIQYALKKPRKKIAVASAADKPVLEAVFEAVKLGFVEPCLIGPFREISTLAARIGMKNDTYEIIDEEDTQVACNIAVLMVKTGKADILMKGMVQTATLLKAVLDKENGIRKKDTLSHFALCQTRYYHKLLGLTDAAMNIFPNIHEKVRIIENAVEILQRLGYQLPKVAVLAPIEVVNTKIPSSSDAALLTSMNRKNQLSGCIIDGPLALDIAISPEAMIHKSIVSEVAGDADILITPDLNSGNILYKARMFLSDGMAASVITGASAPVVLTSRSDSEKNKLYSIALAAAIT